MTETPTGLPKAICELLQQHVTIVEALHTEMQQCPIPPAERTAYDAALRSLKSVSDKVDKIRRRMAGEPETDPKPADDTPQEPTP